MLKYIGILLVSVSITFYGSYLSARLTKARKVRSALKELLLHLQNGIDHGGMPLGALYGSFHSAVLEEYGFIAILKSGHVEAFREALHGTSLPLTDTLYALYDDLGDRLGKSPHRQYESESIGRMLAELQREEEKIQAEEDIKRLLYKKLGLLLGLLAAIILV